MEKKYDFNLDVLRVIKHSGLISGKDLAKAFGHKDTRRTRLAIQHLRLDGIPVCLAPNGGYFYSEKKEDIESTIQSYLKRADEMLTICQRLEGAIDG